MVIVLEHISADFQSQSSPLMPSDLVQTYMLLIAAKKAGKNILAFYNCMRLPPFVYNVD
jgi:ATP adenylyltransferase/5',5'''-P-1,P-4-tetraphosphate phosphorylase II